MPPTATHVWTGGAEFRVVGSERRHDTLRIRSSYRDPEVTFRLELPTLCFTYADMGFANAIGGLQENFPASRAYGPRFFAPPIVLSGREQIEKFTWIRGAFRVTLDDAVTLIEWNGDRDLVIPRLRLDADHPVIAGLSIDSIAIRLDEPLRIDVIQCADGRQVGGVRIEKRHPEWQEEEEESPASHDLRVRVVRGDTLEPMPEVEVVLHRWTADGDGFFDPVGGGLTDEAGQLFQSDRPCEELEIACLSAPGWWAAAPCFSPLPGEEARVELAAWPLEPAAYPFEWRPDIGFEELAAVCGFSIEEFERVNEEAGLGPPEPGREAFLPCYLALYPLESHETLESLVEAFAYESPDELAWLSELESPAQLEELTLVPLPSWFFFSSPEARDLALLDEILGLPLGASRPVKRVCQPRPNWSNPFETVAVPRRGFAADREERIILSSARRG